MKHLVLLAGLAVAAAPQPAGAPFAPAAPAQPEAAEADSECVKPGERRVRAQGPLRARPLGELPPGQLELAVLRTVDGCVRRAVVRTGIGGGPAEEP